MSETIWKGDLLGIIQRQDMDKIPEGYSPLLVNISHDKPGTWSKRKGSEMLGAPYSNGEVYGLSNYLKYDGTDNLRAIRNRDLEGYGTGSNNWSRIASTQFTASEKISSVNFLGKNYYVGPSSYLCSEDSTGTIETVGTSTNRIYGKGISEAQNTLFLIGRPGYEDRVYYSYIDASTGPTAQFYEQGETLETSTRWFTTQAPNTCTISYRDINYIFSHKKCVAFDIRNAINSTGPVKVFDIGCAGQQAANICNGWMVWMDRNARIWAYGGASLPMALSYDIEDDANGEALINLIDKEHIEDVAIGVDKSQFYVSVGDITIKGITFPNCVIRGLVNQSFDKVLWSLYSYPFRIKFFANTRVDNEEVLVAGCDDGNVYQLNKGLNDNATAIDARCYTSFSDFGAPSTTKESAGEGRLLVSYRPQPSVRTYLTVRYATDSKFSYSDISIEGSKEDNPHGRIDMYNSAYTLKGNQVKTIGLPTMNGRTISMEFSNNQVDETFEISGYGMDLAQKPLDVNISSE